MNNQSEDITEYKVSYIKEAIRRYNETIESNEPFCMKDEAWYMMGLAYQKLFDYKKAFACFKKAAEMNYDEAFVKMGDAYMNGLGVKQNPVLAFRWYRKGADMGEINAMLKLADCYKHGTGCKVNYSKAMEQYLHLAERTGRYWQRYAYGIGKALYEIGNIYLEGLGVPVDLKKAAKYFRLAAKKGNRDAESTLKSGIFNNFEK